MKRTSSAHWNGTLKDGSGEISTKAQFLIKQNIHLKPALSKALVLIRKNL